MKNGVIHTYYVWDGRGRGLGEIRLSKDREQALAMREECEKGIIPGQAKQARARILKAPKPHKRRVLDNAEWINAEPWARTMFFNAERRAILAKKSFTLTPHEFLRVVAAANGACQISGIPFEKTKEKSPFAPSLDRMDCSMGYENGNVRLVCHVANVAMNTWGIEPVLRLAKAIIAPTAENLCA